MPPFLLCSLLASIASAKGSPKQQYLLLQSLGGCWPPWGQRGEAVHWRGCQRVRGVLATLGAEGGGSVLERLSEGEGGSCNSELF